MAEHLSRTEVIAALARLGERDRLRLMTCARLYGARYRCEAEELLQMTFADLIGGNRKAPRNLPISVVVRNVIRSNGSNLYYARRIAKGSNVLRMRDGGDDLNLIQDEAADPEQSVIGDREVATLRTRLRTLFDASSTEGKVLEGLLAEMDAQALRRKIGLSASQYRATMKRVHRRIRAAFPNGWKP